MVERDDAWSGRHTTWWWHDVGASHDTLPGKFNENKREDQNMKVVNLCSSGCCPVVKIAEEHVEIGEKDNVCVLSKTEWDTLKQKILNGEI